MEDTVGTKEILWVLRDTVGTKEIPYIRLFTRDVFFLEFYPKTLHLIYANEYFPESY